MKRRVFIGSGLGFGASGLLLPRVALAAREPIVETAQGKVRGRINARGVHVFKGMRYGTAKRFMPPVAPASWRGVQDAFEYGHQSPQLATRLAGPQPMSDD